MKRREVLIIFVLSLSLVAINFHIYDAQGFFGIGTFPLQVISPALINLAAGNLSCFPVEHGIVCPSVATSNFLFVILATCDFLFWFLSLTIGYQLIKWVRQRFFKKAR